MADLKFGDPVVYNGGEGKSHRLAFVLGQEDTDDGGKLANLAVIDGDGNWSVLADVPRRHPDDYDDADPPGGGHTWTYRD